MQQKYVYQKPENGYPEWNNNPEISVKPPPARANTCAMLRCKALATPKGG